MYFHARQWWMGLALGAFGQAALAMGFGAIPSTATLGEPVDMRIPLRLEAGEDVNPECVSATVSFADTVQQPGTTTVKLEPAVPGATQRFLRVLTSTRITEPVVTVELNVGCSSRISRRFTLFADPPLFAPPPIPVAAAVVAAESARAATATASPGDPGAATSAAPLASEQPRAAQPKTVVKRPRPRPTPDGAASAKAPQRAPVAVAPTAPSSRTDAATSRLQLATLEQGASPSAGAAAAAMAAASADDAAAAEAAASAASAASAADAAIAARAAELEASANRLRADADRAQQRINELQARLQQIEAARSSSGLTYLLGAALLVALVALAWLWRQREQERQSNQWLVQAAAKPRADVEGTSSVSASVAPASNLGGFDDTQAAATRTGLLSRLDALGGPTSGSMPLAAERREVSVEELIDLEQQAEFFVVLGQDEAAIDLLMGHLRSASDASPLPYLKLLEIYKRRGDRVEYERLRDRFNRRFAGHAPDWETDLQGGLSLEGYPAVIARLQSLWFQPQRAMEVLQATLLRDPSEDEEGQAGSFDLPAYRELMLLYSVARDLSETREDGVAIDLLLPLDAPAASAAGGSGFVRLAATTPIEAQPSVHGALSVDLPLEDTESAPSIVSFAATEIEPEPAAGKADPDLRL